MYVYMGTHFHEYIPEVLRNSRREVWRQRTRNTLAYQNNREHLISFWFCFSEPGTLSQLSTQPD